MSVEEAADRLASSGFVRVVAHADADGVSSAACLCSALTEAGIGYRFTALDDPSDAASTNADVFCDLGAQYLDEVGDAIVVDHHPPRGGDSFDGVLVGTGSPSSSIAAHSVGSRLSSGDPVSALVGALGDGVDLGEVPDIVDEAVAAGADGEEGARLVGEDAVEGLTYSTRPFTRLSGNPQEARDFVEDIDDIPTAVVLLALTNEAVGAEAASRLVGDVYRLPSGVFLHELSRYVEACAVSGKTGLAFSLCLDTESHLDEARSAWRAFESTLIQDVRGARTEEGEPSFAYVEGAAETGAVADVLKDWVTGDVVAVNEDGEASLRSDGFDCGRVAREAAHSVGGEGGGHLSRAGASFDADPEEFVGAVREIL